MLSSTTISFVGEKNTEAIGTGHGKSRLSVVLAISASGRMLKTLVILKGLKKVPKIKIPANIVVKVSIGGSMNEPIMLDWIQSCFRCRGPYLATTKSLLIMDEYGTHKKHSVIAALKSLNTLIKFIPPKTTHYHQPLDVSVNGPFKAALRHEWDNWLANGPQIFTPKGYRKRPDWETVIGFVSRAVTAIKKECIIKSFVVCGNKEKGERVPHQNLNNKLQSILIAENTDETDLTENECEETMEVVDASDDDSGDNDDDNSD
jgi:hypothetical protein